mmetsp:Transcript_78673/g.238618  ORF Transcript_78673/g.238618 Transcript_78673/m.238618 type:complete len:254 (-) Transcript_78673:126-887(-)
MMGMAMAMASPLLDDGGVQLGAHGQGLFGPLEVVDPVLGEHRDEHREAPRVLRPQRHQVLLVEVRVVPGVGVRLHPPARGADRVERELVHEHGGRALREEEPAVHAGVPGGVLGEALVVVHVLLDRAEGQVAHELEEEDPVAEVEAVALQEVHRALQALHDEDAHLLDGLPELQDAEDRVGAPPEVHVLEPVEARQHHAVEVEDRRAQVVGLGVVVAAVEDVPVLRLVRAQVDVPPAAADALREVAHELGARR